MMMHGVQAQRLSAQRRDIPGSWQVKTTLTDARWREACTVLPRLNQVEIHMNTNLLRALLIGVSMTVSIACHAQASDTPNAQPTHASKKATPADRALGKSVRRALAKAQGFDVSGVFVRSRGGAVTLSGTVKSGEQIQQAEDITRSVQGVTSVTNKLSLFHGGNG